LVVLKRIH